MTREIPSLGELEIHVLRLIWRQQPCTERQIWELIRKERKIGRTTVLKTMQRLEAKNLLARVKNKSPVQFRATADRKRVLPQLVSRFVNGVLGGSADPLVAYLADSSKLTPGDIDALEEIVREMRQQESEQTPFKEP